MNKLVCGCCAGVVVVAEVVEEVEEGVALRETIQRHYLVLWVSTSVSMKEKMQGATPKLKKHSHISFRILLVCT